MNRTALFELLSEVRRVRLDAERFASKAGRVEELIRSRLDLGDAAPGAPSGPSASASELPPYDPNDTSWAPPGRAAEKVGVAISTMRDWIADDTQNRFHRRIGKGRIYVYLPAVVGGSR